MEIPPSFPPHSPNSPHSAEELNIVTLHSPHHDVLQKKTEDLILPREMLLAKEIAVKLFWSIHPFFPAAGCAAPQIGISKSVFIFSYDRKPEHLEVVINPTMRPASNAKVIGWEGCFSCCFDQCWKLAELFRYESIDVTYTNWEGKTVAKRLEGFAAKVFQHEYDHLQGITTIDHKDATVREFATDKEMKMFLDEVKKEDAKRYAKPE